MIGRRIKIRPIMLKLLQGINLPLGTNLTMIIPITPLLFRIAFNFGIPLGTIIQQILIQSQFRNKPYRIAHNIRMSKYKIKELFYKEFP